MSLLLYNLSSQDGGGGGGTGGGDQILFNLNQTLDSYLQSLNIKQLQMESNSI